MDKALTKKVDDLEKEINLLKQKRIGQGDILNDQVKQRAMGEGNRFIRSGLAADRPAVGEPVNSNSSAHYFATDTATLSIWDGTQWVSVGLIP